MKPNNDTYNLSIHLAIDSKLAAAKPILSHRHAFFSYPHKHLYRHILIYINAQMCSYIITEISYEHLKIRKLRFPAYS